MLPQAGGRSGETSAASLVMMPGRGAIGCVGFAGSDRTKVQAPA